MGKIELLKVIHTKSTSNESNNYKPIVLLLIISLLTGVLLTSCKDEVTQPTPKPPGYQEDIPWPSLANSPWPRYHGNMQNNGRTSFNGPISGNIFKEIRIPNVSSGIVIGADSNIYVSHLGYLSSLDKDGNENWSLKLTNNEIHNTPLIASDGTIYIGLFQDKKLVAVNPNGTIKWELNTGEIVQLATCIGLDGTIYFFDLDRNLNAVDKNGNVLWKLFNLDFAGIGVRNSAMSPDGKIIYIITRYKLYAIDLTTHSILWSFFETVQNEPLVDSKGNIYCVAKDTSEPNKPVTFFSLNQNGTFRWKYKLYGWTSLGGQDATMDINGNIYFASDTVYSLDYNGNLRWKKYFANESFPTPFVCDGSGRIYTTSQSGLNLIKTIYCFNSDGSVLWSIPYYIQGLIYWSTTIGYDNSLYIPIDSDSARILIIR